MSGNQAPDKEIEVLQNTKSDDLPSMPEVTRNADTLQWFYKVVTDSFGCMDGRVSPLHLRRAEGYYLGEWAGVCCLAW